MSPTKDFCGILDTLVMARQMHPGARASLDALCKRYGIDNSHRELHGALLDAEILADVYLMMTGGQTDLALGEDESESAVVELDLGEVSVDASALKVIRATDAEVAAHEAFLDLVDKKSEGAVWRR
jgi:DNA polymerase-3 subunit epsilon